MQETANLFVPTVSTMYYQLSNVNNAIFLATHVAALMYAPLALPDSLYKQTEVVVLLREIVLYSVQFFHLWMQSNVNVDATLGIILKRFLIHLLNVFCFKLKLSRANLVLS
jgi:hypothetical protein